MKIRNHVFYNADTFAWQTASDDQIIKIAFSDGFEHELMNGVWVSNKSGEMRGDDDRNYYEVFDNAEFDDDGEFVYSNKCIGVVMAGITSTPQNRYHKKNTVRISIGLNRTTDAEAIAKLDELARKHGSKNNAIKELLKKA